MPTSSGHTNDIIEVKRQDQTPITSLQASIDAMQEKLDEVGKIIYIGSVEQVCLQLFDIQDEFRVQVGHKAATCVPKNVEKFQHNAKKNVDVFQSSIGQLDARVGKLLEDTT